MRRAVLVLAAWTVIAGGQPALATSESDESEAHSAAVQFFGSYLQEGSCTVRNGPGTADDVPGHALEMRPEIATASLDGRGHSFRGTLLVATFYACTPLTGPVNVGEIPFTTGFGTTPGEIGVDPLDPAVTCAAGEVSAGRLEVYAVPSLSTWIPVAWIAHLDLKWQVFPPRPFAGDPIGACSFADRSDSLGSGQSQVVLAATGVPALSMRGTMLGAEQHATDVDTVDMSPCTVTLVEDAFFDLKRSPSGAADTSLCAIAKWPVRQGVRATVRG